MRNKILDRLSLIVAPVPPLITIFAEIVPCWWIFLAASIVMLVGVFMWRGRRGEKSGIICVAVAVLLVVAGIVSLCRPDSPKEVAEVGVDPMRSFFLLEDDAQRAYDTGNVFLQEAMSTELLRMNDNEREFQFHFAYYDDIWHSLDRARREGSAIACYNMAYMCANGKGRERSVRDAVEYAVQSIHMGHKSYQPYVLLDELNVDSSNYPEAYCILQPWRDSIMIEDSLFRTEMNAFAKVFVSSLEGSLLEHYRCIEAFEQVLYAEKSSYAWKLMNRWSNQLRLYDEQGKVGWFTQYLSAYYSGIHKVDSALYYYYRFISKADWLTRTLCYSESNFYTIIPDTTICMYEKINPSFLLCLGNSDLYYISDIASASANQCHIYNAPSPYLAIACEELATMRSATWGYLEEHEDEKEVRTFTIKHSRNRLIQQERMVTDKPHSDKYNLIVNAKIVNRRFFKPYEWSYGEKNHNSRFKEIDILEDIHGDTITIHPVIEFLSQK